MSIEKVWFVYKRDFAMRWCPMTHHGEKPKHPKHSDLMMTTPIEVPPDCLDFDGSPHFGELKRRFPPPQEKDDG